MADYELVCVARTPRASGPPRLVEVDRVEFVRLAWTGDLNRDGSMEFSCLAENLPADVRARLADPAGMPTEFRLYRITPPSTVEIPGEPDLYGDFYLDAYSPPPLVRATPGNARIVWQGPLWGFQRQEDGRFAVNCRGLLAYTRGMWVGPRTGTKTYSATDQHFIVKDLLDTWQAFEFGHFGLDTSQIAASGVTRDVTYEAAELHNYYQRMGELGTRIDGFDVWVDPQTREVRCDHPRRGSDLSESVVFDQRNIVGGTVDVSVTDRDLSSEFYGVGTGETPIVTQRTNAALRETFGLWAHGSTFDGVSVQATLDAHAQRALDARDTAMIVPGPGLIPVVDADVDDFDVGDVVTLQYDYGWGLIGGALRIGERRVQVDEAGREDVAVVFGDRPFETPLQMIARVERQMNDLRDTALVRVT